jgi:hypothetical protein
VIHHGEPISDPKEISKSSLGQLINDDLLHDALGDVHAARGLKTVVADRSGVILEQNSKFIHIDNFLSNRLDQLEALLERELVDARSESVASSTKLGEKQHSVVVGKLKGGKSRTGRAETALGSGSMGRGAFMRLSARV